MELPEETQSTPPQIKPKPNQTNKKTQAAGNFYESCSIELQSGLGLKRLLKII